MLAEIQTWFDSPIAWLKSGPGWTTTVKPVITQDNRQFSVLLAPEMQSLFAADLQVLSPYPQARTAVAARHPDQLSFNDSS